MDRRDIFDHIDTERERQVAKHGDQAISSPLIDDGTRLIILGEEFGEVCRAMTYDNGSRENLIEELLQTAAVCIGWLESIEPPTVVSLTFDFGAAERAPEA